MSIRLKLILTYILTVIVSVFIVVFILITMMGRLITGAVDMIVEDSSVEVIATEFIDILVELRHAQKYDEAELEDPAFIQQIDDRLEFFNSGLVVFANDSYINVSDYPSTKEFYSHLVKVDHYKNRTSEDEPLAFDYDSKSYFYFSVDYSGNDNESIIANDNESINANDNEVVYFFIKEINKKETLATRNLSGIVLFFAILVTLLLMPVILIIQKDIIRPLKELERGAKHITDGDLEYKMKIKSYNEVGNVVFAYEKMRQELKKSIQRQIQIENNRKELISSISHDLKTPITSIKGYVEGILDGVANTEEKKQRYLDVIHQKSLDMDRLIDDLFLFSKLDLHKMPFEFEAVNMAPWTKEIVEQVALDHRELATVEFEYENLSDSLPVISMDPIQIKRVIQNLVQNSVKYNHSDDKLVTVKILNTGEQVTLSVKDNGIGMNEEELQHAFDMFYRSDASRNTNTGGSGLGLAIVKQIVIEHGGTIHAKSQPQVGTTIQMVFNKVSK